MLFFVITIIFTATSVNGVITPIGPTSTVCDEVFCGSERFVICNDALNWNDAKDLCDQDGGYLAVLAEQDQNECVTDFIKTHDDFKDITDGFWIGCTDALCEGEFEWHDGTSFDFFDWYQQPSCGNQQVLWNSINRDCCQIWKTPADMNGVPDMKWYSDDCTHTKGFVCQYDETPPVIPTVASWSTWGQWSSCDAPCGPGIETRSRVCYNQQGSGTPDCIGNPSQTRECTDAACPDCAQVCEDGVLDSGCIFCVCVGNVLTGTVTDIAGRPLNGVLVYRVEDMLNPVATTDDVGRFEVQDVCENSGFTFKKNGFIPVTRTVLDRDALTVAIQLSRIEPVVMIEHPQSKVRMVGESVTLCCEAKGNPAPVYYEWFYNGIIIDGSIYNNGNTLTLNNLILADSGDYKCRANSDGGAQYSNEASLQVIESPDSVCDTNPVDKLLKLPEDCVTDDGTNYYNVGTCSRNKCPVSNPSGCIDSQENCCAPASTAVHTVSCTRFSIQVTVVTACGCLPCGRDTIMVRGRAVAADDRSPLSYGMVYVQKELVDRTNGNGEFSFEVSKGATRLAVTFKDRLNNLIDTTKIFSLDVETAVYYIVAMQRRVDAVVIDSMSDSDIPLGGDGSDPVMDLHIPTGSFCTASGTPYTGNVKASVTLVDVTDPLVVDVIQSDLSTRNAEGEQAFLETFGMFSMQFTDDDDSPLRVDGTLQLYIDAEKANIDDSASDLPRLWFLNEETGEWEDAGGLEITQGRRRKRQTQTFLVGNISLVGYDLDNLPVINIDAIENGPRICYLKVRAYTDESLSIPLDEAQVTAISRDQVVRYRYPYEFNVGRFNFFNTKMTHGGSACLLTFCARDPSLFAVNVNVEYNGEILTAMQPSDVPSDKHPGQWPSDLLQSFTLPEFPLDESGYVKMLGLTPQLSDIDDPYEYQYYSDYDYDTFNYDMITSRQLGPFYWQWYDRYKAGQYCNNAPIDENHLVFFQKETSGLVLHTTEPLGPERDRTPASWYPYENEDKRVCFIKVLVTSPRSERIRVTSLTGKHPAVDFIDTYGVSIDNSKPNPPNTQISSNTAACVEFKCSSYLRLGDPYGTDRIGEPDAEADETILEISPSSSSWQRCWLKAANATGQVSIKDMNPDLSDFLADHELSDTEVFIEDQKLLRFQVPFVDIPDYQTGIYVSKGGSGDRDALINCHGGNDVEYLQRYPETHPDASWAIAIECQ